MKRRIFVGSLAALGAIATVAVAADHSGPPAWPRDQFSGPGGGLYQGPRGGLSLGPGGGLYRGLGGGMYEGPGGGLYRGPGGGLSVGPGGGLFAGPGGGLSRAPGGGLFNGPGGFFYPGPGGGLWDKHSAKPFHRNWPPINVLVDELRRQGFEDIVQMFRAHGLAA